MAAIVTKESLQRMLASQDIAYVDQVIGRALVALLALKHKKLLQWQREMWLKPNKNGTARIAKYHKQLNEIVEEKKQCSNV